MVFVRTCKKTVGVPQELFMGLDNSFESCKGSSITKRNKELGSLKKGGIWGILGNSWRIPQEYETKYSSPRWNVQEIMSLVKVDMYKYYTTVSKLNNFWWQRELLIIIII